MLNRHFRDLLVYPGEGPVRGRLTQCIEYNTRRTTIGVIKERDVRHGIRIGKAPE